MEVRKGECYQVHGAHAVTLDPCSGEGELCYMEHSEPMVSLTSLETIAVCFKSYLP